MTKRPEEFEGPPIDKPAERLKQFRDARRPREPAEESDAEVTPRERDGQEAEGGTSDEELD